MKRAGEMVMICHVEGAIWRLYDRDRMLAGVSDEVCRPVEFRRTLGDLHHSDARLSRMERVQRDFAIVENWYVDAAGRR